MTVPNTCQAQSGRACARPHKLSQVLGTHSDALRQVTARTGVSGGWPEQLRHVPEMPPKPGPFALLPTCAPADPQMRPPRATCRTHLEPDPVR